MIKRFLIAFLICLSTTLGWAADYTVSTGTSTVDGDTFCGGSACTSADTITITGGSRGDLLFKDFNGNGSYITIQNENTNRVVITENGDVTRGILSIQNCKYIDLRGDNNTSFAWSSGCKSSSCYGIKVVGNGATVGGGIYMWDQSDHVKFSYIEVDMTNSTGSTSPGIKTQDVDLTNAWTFDTIEIHHNYIHNTRYSGMYLGHNKPSYTGVGQECTDGCPYVANYSVHDNLLEDLGAYGITLKGISASNTLSEIYNNQIMASDRTSGNSTGLLFNAAALCTGSGTPYGGCTGSGTGDLSNYQDGIGVQYVYGEAVDIYDNWTEKTRGMGMKFGRTDMDSVEVFNNVILEAGTGGSTSYAHGIWYGNSGTGITVYNNTIINADKYGIYGQSGAVTSGTHKDNFIVGSGSGEFGGDTDFSEGTGAYANTVEATVSGAGFVTWSDDSDYSNDDFNLTVSSSAVGAAGASGYPSDDYDGTSRPQGSDADDGAYEYSPGGTTTPTLNAVSLSGIKIN